MAFDITCSGLNLLSVEDENKIKTLKSVLILKPVSNPSILCLCVKIQDESQNGAGPSQALFSNLCHLSSDRFDFR